ncbi:hypothetical protein SAMN05421823_104535 [Catalinimonas alkaloidigena]|uniref:Uncharacterized protein n=1 Tax=Catalinimonas alkaloidigena TaxID=1075417 RepID=A0A1G9HTT4_9BACT|nr:hypothetical protein [Catalinimonas alkaloidigena]SDL16252.1 hypothetical protein SAMN05421823_104535 [Catalinimonas alkaloidigena]
MATATSSPRTRQHRPIIYKKRYFSAARRIIVGFLVFVLGSIFLLSGTPTGLVLGAIFYMTCLFLWFTYTYVEVDTRKKIGKDQVRLFGLALSGEVYSFESIEYLFFKANSHNDTANPYRIAGNHRLVRYDAFLKFSDGAKQQVFRSDNYDKAYRKARHIAKTLRVEFVDYTAATAQ